MFDTRQIVEAAIAKERTRSSWNDRLWHWERPASDSEETKIQRAADAARLLVTGNATLCAESVQIRPQGSYYNNTNVRLEADMDLRVQLPGIITVYADGVSPLLADGVLGYSSTGRAASEIARSVRDALASDCRRRFGAANVSVGKKAVTVDGLSGSRADVDLVPAFHLHHVMADGLGGYLRHEGVVIVSADGSQTFNFPEQHHANGKAKRSRTQHRFKKNVRMLKRLNYELFDQGAIPKRIPSFLVECLVYVVEDWHFLVQEDRYDRLVRILRRLRVRLGDATWVETATEVNEIKYLFRSSQAWNLADARNFVDAALVRLGG
ncbi:hypothetical protein [Methylobacterium pseudosasicola]|uniref:cGAS/DncV-like nucleotidyltransferase C-terminal helical domain-containing protein n=1 Tax=Methylobacterium pseudosasicola TaxID=582667 RepID=A0A1I4PU50_9HYPH|nr:hypothetical protein [Methylobacterium pseudosasicola]SFM31274.1 hypothetical protein SAMN05192568_102667 [Methylobacterium pseudosasicola]